jgi:hypothetical protein
MKHQKLWIRWRRISLPQQKILPGELLCDGDVDGGATRRGRRSSAWVRHVSDLDQSLSCSCRGRERDVRPVPVAERRDFLGNASSETSRDSMRATMIDEERRKTLGRAIARCRLDVGKIRLWYHTKRFGKRCPLWVIGVILILDNNNNYKEIRIDTDTASIHIPT